MLYTELTIGSVQLEDTELYLFLAESISFFQLQLIWCNDLHVRWDCFGKADSSSSLKIWKKLFIIMTREMKVTMIIYCQFRLWGLCIFIQFPPLRPLLTQLITRKHSVPFLPSCQDDPKLALLWRGPLALSIWWNTPSTPEVDSKDEEYPPIADLDDPVWSEKPMPDNQKYLCTHEIP